MGIATITATNILLLIFNASAWANYADNAGSSPQTNIGVALHTADPTPSGDATSNEMANANNANGYQPYTRVNVARSSGGWTVTNNVVVPVTAISFPAGTAGSGVAKFFSLSKSNANPPTGAQPILFSGTVTPNISCGNSVTPRLTTATSVTMT